MATQTTTRRGQAHQVQQSEQQNVDYRLAALNTMLTTPHGDLSKVWPVHEKIVKEDPLFYVRLAAWYNTTGDVRDHKEMFVATLCLSDFPGHRDVGLAMLRELPPHQVCNVVDFVTGCQVKEVYEVPVVAEAGKKPPKKKTQKKSKLVSFGLGRNMPRSMRMEISRYLRDRESNVEHFESAVLQCGGKIRRLYAKSHTKPSELAHKTLFENIPVEGGRIEALRKLQKAATPAEQAQAIVDNKIPFRIATSVVKNMTPTVLAALIEVMSPQELINSVGMLKKRGAMENPDLKAMIDAKLEGSARGKNSKKVSSLKVAKAINATGIDGETRAKLEAVADRSLKKMGRITRPTVLLCDKSGSMQQAIELAKQIGSMVSTAMDTNTALHTYAFDTMAYPIKASGPELAKWETAFAGIKADGGTSCGIGLQMLLHQWRQASPAEKSRFVVEQVILVSDQEEAGTPKFVTALQSYIRETGATPHVVFVRCGKCLDNIEREMGAAKLEFDTWTFGAGADYYSLPNLIPLLQKGSKTDLLFAIMEWDLPVRKAA